MKVTILARSFSFQQGKETINLADPNPAMTAAEVAKFYSAQHPALTTATVDGPKVKGDKQAFEFKTTVGTKG